jgi:dephospho-CoA kinase
MIVSITGKIGSGKSTVAKMFHEYGFALIDADEIGHEVMKDEKNRSDIKTR